ncbi:hypothetical protein SG26_20305 (plasmid) [Haloarcula sp. CBA1115]|uniref:hypothetical protein n=1 Tax=Haloarcula sp. CBA1115 TaxID=1592728 RepID=UPI00059553AE|nr:hypothetical protein [Haloarcula sp. CBA1115]AJF28093.1 hypothetical protein SG26_20305 [Haloarcula sp. CBA1115]
MPDGGRREPPNGELLSVLWRAVDAAQVFAVDSEFIEQGVIGDSQAHVALEGGQLTIYSHAEEAA